MPRATTAATRAALLARHRAALDRAISALDRADSLDAAWAEATELAREVDAMRTEVGDLRGRIADRMRQRDGLTFARLAERLDVSRMRAQTLVARAGRDRAAS